MSSKGYRQSEEHKRKIGEANKVSLRGQRHSPKTEFKKGLHPSVATEFKKGHGWKGGKIESSKRYYEKNKPKFANNVIKRRAMERGVSGSHSVVEWETLKAQYNWTCPCCHKFEPEIKLSVDHIIPLIRGGSNNIENIQPLCRSCNCKKNDRLIPKYNSK